MQCRGTPVTLYVLCDKLQARFSNNGYGIGRCEVYLWKLKGCRLLRDSRILCCRFYIHICILTSLPLPATGCTFLLDEGLCTQHSYVPSTVLVQVCSTQTQLKRFSTEIVQSFVLQQKPSPKFCIQSGIFPFPGLLLDVNSCMHDSHRLCTSANNKV